jgi:hypothetical protein
MTPARRRLVGAMLEIENRYGGNRFRMLRHAQTISGLDPLLSEMLRERAGEIRVDRVHRSALADEPEQAPR